MKATSTSEVDTTDKHFITFAAAQLPVHERSWDHGAEATYTLNADFVVTSVSDDVNFGTNVTTKLRCRPKGNDALSCRLDDLNAYNYNGKTVKTNGAEWERVDDPNDIRSVSMRHLPFEVKFHSKGVDHLIVSNGNHSTDWKLDVIRYTANLLSLGVDYAKNFEGSFKDTEDSVLGQCTVKYDLKYQPLGGEKKGMEKVNYELKTVAPRHQGSKGTLSLKKEMILNNCADFTPHPVGVTMIGDFLERVNIDYVSDWGGLIWDWRSVS